MAIKVTPKTTYNQIWENQIRVGDRELNCFSWSVDVGTYGQIGKVSAKTTVSLLRAAGITLDTLASNANGGKIPLTVSVNGNTIFTGTYLHGFYAFHADEVEIWGRDLSAVLFDTKRSVASIGYENTTVSQFISNICSRFGVPLSISIENNPYVGTVFESSGQQMGGSSMATYPQPLWNLIVFLVKQTGAQIYTTADGMLHVVSAPTTPITTRYSWLATPGEFENSIHPILMLDVLHQPERNKNFAVVFISHHAQQVAFYTHTVTVAGEDIETPGIKTIPAGFYKGNVGQQIQSALSSRGLGIPVFEFRQDGLTQDAVRANAEGIAKLIAQKLFVMHAVIDGNPNLLPNQQIQIFESQPGSLLGFASKQMFISELRHSCGIPQGHDISNDGFLTTMKLLSLPPRGTLDQAEISTLLQGNT